MLNLPAGQSESQRAGRQACLPERRPARRQAGFSISIHEKRRKGGITIAKSKDSGSESGMTIRERHAELDSASITIEGVVNTRTSFLTTDEILKPAFAALRLTKQAQNDNTGCHAGHFYITIDRNKRS